MLFLAILYLAIGVFMAEYAKRQMKTRGEEYTTQAYIFTVVAWSVILIILGAQAIRRGNS